MASTWRSSIITGVMRPESDFNRSVVSCLEKSNAEESCSALKLLLAEENNGRMKGKILEVLKELDSLFYNIHPRAILEPSMTYISASNNHWLKKVKASRTMKGYYYSDGAYKLVPRGPLVRLPRPEYASSAISFSDRFTSLSVVPHTLYNEMIPISVNHIVKSTGLVSGVKPGKKFCEELIAFLPIAEADSDIDLSQRSTEAACFVNFRASDSLNVPKTVLKALGDMGHVDIAIAPELIVNTDDADKIAEHLSSNTTTHRILVLGTGHTSALENGQSWNEGRAVNGLGATLWKQRKFWQAGITDGRALDLGLEPAKEGRQLMEDNATGDEIVVADIDGFGRCVMLICQDLQCRPLTDDLIRLFQPDWVFTPILDIGIDEGRWMHTRAYELSALSPARFLIATSTALASKLGKGDVACGLAIGPRARTDDDEGRSSHLAFCDKANGKSFGFVEWREGWAKTKLSIE